MGRMGKPSIKDGMKAEFRGWVGKKKAERTAQFTAKHPFIAKMGGAAFRAKASRKAKRENRADCSNPACDSLLPEAFGPEAIGGCSRSCAQKVALMVANDEL